MAPFTPRRGQIGSGSISDSEFNRYVNALSQQPAQGPPARQIGSGSTSGMELRAYQKYLDAMSRLRAVERQPRASAGSGSTSDLEFERYGGYVDPAISELSSAPPELSAAPAAEAQNREAQDKLIYRLLSAEKPPATGPLGDFFESMGNKVR